MTPVPRLLALLLALCWPGAALADGSPAPPAEEEENDGWDDETGSQDDPSNPIQAAPALDPVTARMLEIVDLYYAKVHVVPTEEERARGLESAQMMLLSGVAVTDMTKAVDVAIRLHTPGRRIPFEIAVPLRVGTNISGTRTAPEDTTSPAHSTVKADPAVSFSPEESARRSQIREAEEARRTRYGLYRQWQSRTLLPRTLLSVGIPMLATGYITSFVIAGGVLLAGGPLTHQQAWLSAIPIFGPAIIAGVTDGMLNGMALLTAIQGSGAGLIVLAIAIRKKFPTESDPTALLLGKKRDGRPAVEIRFRPSLTGAGLVGRF